MGTEQHTPTSKQPTGFIDLKQPFQLQEQEPLNNLTSEIKAMAAYLAGQADRYYSKNPTHVYGHGVGHTNPSFDAIQELIKGTAATFKTEPEDVTTDKVIALLRGEIEKILTSSQEDALKATTARTRRMTGYAPFPSCELSITQEITGTSVYHFTFICATQQSERKLTDPEVIIEVSDGNAVGISFDLPAASKNTPIHHLLSLIGLNSINDQIETVYQKRKNKLQAADPATQTVLAQLNTIAAEVLSQTKPGNEHRTTWNKPTTTIDSRDIDSIIAMIFYKLPEIDKNIIRLIKSAFKKIEKEELLRFKIKNPDTVTTAEELMSFIIENNLAYYAFPLLIILGSLFLIYNDNQQESLGSGELSAYSLILLSNIFFALSIYKNTRYALHDE